MMRWTGNEPWRLRRPQKRTAFYLWLILIIPVIASEMLLWEWLFPLADAQQKALALLFVAFLAARKLFKTGFAYYSRKVKEGEIIPATTREAILLGFFEMGRYAVAIIVIPVIIKAFYDFLF